MNHEKLSKRLEKVAQYVPKNARLADIGSDHAYLPCYLITQNQINFAIAGEVVKGPYESAKKKVDALNLSDRIHVRLANGCDAITSEDCVDTVTICGMGGDLMTAILKAGYDNHKLDGVQTLILQPNVDTPIVREWLMTHGYAIQSEYVLEENKRIYDIVVATKQENNLIYTKKQIQFGIQIPIENKAVFLKKWQFELEKNQTILKQLEQSSKDETHKIASVIEKIRCIQEVLYESKS